MPQNDLYAIIVGCCDGNRAAQEKLYRMYHGAMLGVCLRYCSCREDAVEVLNTGFLCIFSNIEKIRDRPEQFQYWAKRIMINKALDHMRSIVADKKRAGYAVEYDETNSDRSYNDAVSDIGVDELLSYVQDLPDRTRAVFNMYVFENMKHREIAERLGINENTSQWHMRNARVLLRARLPECMRVAG